MTASTARLLGEFMTSNCTAVARHHIVEPSKHEQIAMSTRGASLHTLTADGDSPRIQRVKSYVDVHLIDEIEVVEECDQSVTLICRTRNDMTVTRVRLWMSPDLFFSAVCAGERDDRANL